MKRRPRLMMLVLLLVVFSGCATESNRHATVHSSLTLNQAREIAISTAKAHGVDIPQYTVTPVLENGEWFVYFEHLDEGHIPRRLCLLATPAGGEFVLVD
jgi:hypothetical protein